MIEKEELKYLMHLYGVVRELSKEKRTSFLMDNNKKAMVTSEIGIDIDYEIKEKGMVQLRVSTPEDYWDQVFSQEKAKDMLKTVESILANLG